MIEVHDSVRLIAEDYIDRIHATIGHGRIHAGHAPTAQSNSIPSKYITIVTPNADKKGFNARAKRFPTYPANANPGPGSYIDPVCLIKPNDISYSKKGFGGLVTKERRCPPKLLPGIESPGVGSYNLLEEGRPDFNRAHVSRLFHAPLATKQLDPMRPKPKAPPPNRYTLKDPEQITRGAAQAAFKSSLPRICREQAGLDPSLARNPPPWSYSVATSLAKKDAFSSVFKSKTRREVIGPPKRSNPGPGYYDPPSQGLLGQPSTSSAPEKVSRQNAAKTSPITAAAAAMKRTAPSAASAASAAAADPSGASPSSNKKPSTLPRKHYLCISAPAMPLPAAEPHPGPGAYEVAQFRDPPKKYMSSSMFVSTTSRLKDAGRDPDLPAPWSYETNEKRMRTKASFHFNSAKRWM